MIRRKHAFTLVELLVVIAILSTLAAMILPVFSLAREQARAIACLSNTRQIASSALLYMQDYDEMLLPARTARDSDPLDLQIATCWVHLLQPYLKNDQVFLCPSFDPKRTAQAMDTAACDGNGTPGSGSNGFVPPAQYLAHYGVAVYLTFGTCTQANPYARFPGSGWQDTAYPGLPAGPAVFHTDSLASIVSSARTAFAGDALTVVRSDIPVVGTLFGCEGAFRHKGSGCNLCFLDGHARYLPQSPESYLQQDIRDGCWFEQYFTADR